MTTRTPEDDVGVAVIGCGAWGINIVRTVHELGRLRAVVDRTAAARERAAGIAPGVRVHDDPRDVLDDPAIRAVMIATPAETHHDLARRALAAGKDVFVEKPLTVGVEDARDLVARAADADRLLMVGHLLEYHPAILALRELVASGALGTIRYIVSNRLNLGKIRVRENALWSFAPHDIAVILRLVGSMPTEIVATGGAYVSPDIADVTVTQLRFGGGVRAHVFVSWLHPFKEQKLVVVGSKKMASFCDVTKELQLYDQRVDWQQGQPVPVKGDGMAVEFDPEPPLRAECRHFLECVASRATPRTDGRNGVRVLEILHAAQRSLLTDGQPVRLHADGGGHVEVKSLAAGTPEPKPDPSHGVR